MEQETDNNSFFTPKRIRALVEIVIGTVMILLGTRYMGFGSANVPVTVLLVLFHGTVTWFMPEFGWIEGIGAFVLALFESLGNVEAIDAVTASASLNGPFWLYFLVTLSGGFCFFRALISFLFHVLDRYQIRKPKKRGMKPLPLIAALTVFGFFCFLPYYLTQYPAIVNADSMWQIQQALGNTPLNTWLSIFHTLIIRMCLNIGHALFKSENAALAVYSIFSMFVMSFTFACVICAAYKRGVRGVGLVLLILFYYLTPFNGIYSVTVWKDVLFGAALLGFSTVLFCIFTRKKSMPVLYCIIMFITGVCLCLLRSNGVYAYFVCIPFLILAAGKFRIKIAGVAVLTAVFYLVFNGPIINALGADREGIVESISIPIQQIAYTVSNGGAITDAECEVLNKVVDTTQIEDTYVPYISDAMKDLVRSTGDLAYLEANKGEFFGTWLSIGLRNPLAYIKGFALETRGFWFFPNEYYWKYVSGITLWHNEETGFAPAPKVNPAFINHLLEFYDHHVYSLFWSISLTSWAMIILFLYCIKKKQQVWISILPAVLVLGTLMLATPVSQEFRYAYGLFLTLPALIALTGILPVRNADSEDQENSGMPKAVAIVLSVLLVAGIILLNRSPNTAAKKISFVIAVTDNESNTSEYRGKAESWNLEEIIEKAQEKGELKVETEEVNGELHIRSVNGVKPDTDSERWSYKINWGEAMYDLKQAEIPDYDEVYIELIYENDNW